MRDTRFLAWFVAIITAAQAEVRTPGYEAKVDNLSSRIRQIEKQNHELAKQHNELAIQNRLLMEKHSDLERKIISIQKNVKADPTTTLMFDCYLTSEWHETGPITFDGCEGKDRPFEFVSH